MYLCPSASTQHIISNTVRNPCILSRQTQQIGRNMYPNRTICRPVRDGTKQTINYFLPTCSPYGREIQKIVQLMQFVFFPAFPRRGGRCINSLPNCWGGQGEENSAFLSGSPTILKITQRCTEEYRRYTEKRKYSYPTGFTCGYSSIQKSKIRFN